MTQYFSPLCVDGYKVFHPFAYKPGITHVFSNLTPRFGKHTNIPGSTGMMFVGLQAYILDQLIDNWNQFFLMDEDEAVNEYKRVVCAMLNKQISVKHIRDLHKLGYLPLEIKALPEGSYAPYGVPVFTVVNTVPGFGWVTNMIETDISSELWQMCTSATTAFEYRKNFEACKFIPKAAIPYLGHDFSYRGMPGRDPAAKSGFGHLLSFLGSDTIVAALFAEKFYGARVDQEQVFAGVDATEHSVMCSYGTEGELESLRHLIKDVTPEGIISIVSDTWDFWKLVTEYLVTLKDEIMDRAGTVVIRPDSGDPVRILCGYTMAYGVEFDTEEEALKWFANDSYGFEEACLMTDGSVYLYEEERFIESHEAKGLVECLWDIFGGTTDENDMKMLDSHIGAIYGDSITLERQQQIIDRLVFKGFVPTVVLGIGSFTYQYVTRDTHGTAVKATDTQFGTGNHVAISKDPKTDASKKSAKGLLMVVKENGKFVLKADVTPEEEASTDNELKTVFYNGTLIGFQTLAEIREVVMTELQSLLERTSTERTVDLLKEELNK